MLKVFYSGEFRLPMQHVGLAITGLEVFDMGFFSGVRVTVRGR